MTPRADIHSLCNSVPGVWTQFGSLLLMSRIQKWGRLGYKKIATSTGALSLRVSWNIRSGRTQLPCHETVLEKENSAAMSGSCGRSCCSNIGRPASSQWNELGNKHLPHPPVEPWDDSSAPNSLTVTSAKPPSWAISDFLIHKNWNNKYLLVEGTKCGTICWVAIDNTITCKCSQEQDR